MIRLLCLLIATLPIAKGYCSDEEITNTFSQQQSVIAHHNGFYFPDNRVTYQNMGKLYPNATLFNGNHIWKLNTVPSSLDNLIIKDGNESYPLGKIGNHRKIDSVVVLEKGNIRFEKYFNGQTEYTRHQLNSVTKSVSWLAIQPLIDSGKIDPDAQVSHYLPELAHSAWGDAKVSQVAAMTTSLQYDEDYAKPDSGFNRYLAAGNFIPGEQNPPGLLAFLRGIKKAAHPQGSQFNYATVNTDVMCLIAEKVANKPAWQIIEDNVWKKIGAERDAFILLDNKGQTFCGAGMSATTRDIARLGQVVLNTVTGNTPRFDSPGLANLIKDKGNKKAWDAGDYGKKISYEQGYNHFWWFIGDKEQIISAEGINGQLVYIDPEKNIVIAVNSSFVNSDADSDWKFLFSVASQITDQLSQNK
ncbi:CubicO group peptidase, beta-lactamase class C family [Izhakiella capsodis]|uniref:CubicO group peptidase, beta-lactamase class C family n=2 Tax=Izhakiella capsodis TaxID=1367852 RepID=A0A1I4YTE3_9GAMM|nr:CubicO group peptidase, beta-lactamase class C family [Izhakiella capsodis]